MATKKSEPGKLQLVQVMGYRCERCSHVWVPRKSTDRPKICPKCKSPYWDREREAK